MITAEQARELAGPTVDERIEDISSIIETAAKNKQREVIIREGFWSGESYSRTKNWLEAQKKLQGLGYTVEAYYNEGSFCVDIGTKISW